MHNEIGSIEGFVGRIFHYLAPDEFDVADWAEGDEALEDQAVEEGDGDSRSRGEGGEEGFCAHELAPLGEAAEDEEGGGGVEEVGRGEHGVEGAEEIGVSRAPGEAAREHGEGAGKAEVREWRRRGRRLRRGGGGGGEGVGEGEGEGEGFHCVLCEWIPVSVWCLLRWREI